jgi:hypothetical protein
MLKQNVGTRGKGLVSPINQLWDDYFREYGVDIKWFLMEHSRAYTSLIDRDSAMYSASFRR